MLLSSCGGCWTSKGRNCRIAGLRPLRYYVVALRVRSARTRWTNPAHPRCPTKGRTIPTSPHRWIRPNSHELAAPWFSSATSSGLMLGPAREADVKKAPGGVKKPRFSPRYVWQRMGDCTQHTRSYMRNVPKLGIRATANRWRQRWVAAACRILGRTCIAVRWCGARMDTGLRKT